jgi:mycoredoxin
VKEPVLRREAGGRVNPHPTPTAPTNRTEEWHRGMQRAGGDVHHSVSLSTDSSDTPQAIEVYWRPGCGYCDRLLRTLRDAEVTVRLHNIWEDDDARQFVRRHNRGNETVPTVAVGSDVMTNPSPRRFVEQLLADHPGLVRNAAYGSRSGG